MDFRYIGAEAMESVSEKFDLLPPMIDWQYMHDLSDEKIGILVNALESSELSDDDDYAIMYIVVDALNTKFRSAKVLRDDVLKEGIVAKVWDRVMALLRRNISGYQSILDIYMGLDQEPRCRDAISPYLHAAIPEFVPDDEPYDDQKH